MNTKIQEIFNDDFIIAPRSLHRELLRIKAAFPYSKTKLLSKEELRELIYGHLETAAIYETISHFNLSYINAKNYLSHLNFFQESQLNEKLVTLFSIFNHLKNKGLYIEGEGPIAFKNKRATLINYSSHDRELQTLLKDCQCQYRFFTPASGRGNVEMRTFSSISEEVSFQLNAICRLLHEGVNPSDIYLLRPSGDYDLDLQFWMKEFSLKLDVGDQKSLITFPFVQDFLRHFDEFDIPNYLESLDETKRADIREFKRVLLNFPQRQLSDSDYKSLLIDQLNSKQIDLKVLKSHINIIDEIPHFFEGKHIFILGFVKGQFPHVYLDNDFIFDFEKDALGINNSGLKNEVNRDLILSSLKTNNHFYISYSHTVNGQKQMMSELLDSSAFVLPHDNLPSSLYSRVYLEGIYGRLSDRYNKFNLYDRNIETLKALAADLNYDTYKHDYQGVKHFTDQSYLMLSFSQLDAYYSCPFRYYLEKVLKLGDKSQTLSMTIGTLFHSLLEKSDEGEVDVDDFIYQFLSSANLEKKEQLIIRGMSDLFHSALRLKLELEDQMAKHTSEAEIELGVQLDDLTEIKGRIDRLYRFENGGLVLIDYKTGIKKFNVNHVDYGKSLQLPIYALLVKSERRLMNDHIIGLFLQKLKQDSLIISEDEEEIYLHYKRSFKFSGILIDEVDQLEKFDSTFIGQYSQYISGARYSSKTNTFHANTANFCREFFDTLAEKAKSKVKEAAQRIRKNDFVIRPLKIDDEDSCKYCPFSHICYKDEKDYLIVSSKKKTEEDNDEIE